MKDRILRLIKVLGRGHKTLVFPFHLGKKYFDGVELIDRHRDFILFSHQLNSKKDIPGEDEMEYWTLSENLNNQELNELVLLLENILIHD